MVAIKGKKPFFITSGENSKSPPCFCDLLRFTVAPRTPARCIGAEWHHAHPQGVSVQTGAMCTRGVYLGVTLNHMPHGNGGWWRSSLVSSNFTVHCCTREEQNLPLKRKVKSCRNCLVSCQF